MADNNLMARLSVSVLMSVFNGQAFLSKAIESILCQTFRDFEFVIIDDGSTDRTAEILSTYANRDARVRVFRHENKGRAESLNIGITLATGRYIARMDADDIALPNRLQEQVSFLNDHPNVGLIGGRFELISNDGSNLLYTISFPTEDSEIRSAMLVDNPFCHPTVVMRKAVAEISGGYRKALVDADDYDLWLRISEQSELANLGTCVLKYRIHPDQVSIKNMTHQKMCVLAARAAAGDRRRGLPDPLSHVEEVNRDLLERLGVSKVEIDANVLGGYRYWVNILEQSYPEAALGAMNGILDLYNSGSVGRREAADTWLKAAGIHYRLGRPLEALFCAGHGILSRPTIAGRPIRTAFMRLAGMFKS